MPISPSMCVLIWGQVPDKHNWQKHSLQRNPALPGPVPGIRFFNYRQGFIDYEYLKLAAEKDPQTVDKIVTEIVSGSSVNIGLPGVMKKVRYPVGNKPYFKARKKLLKIILGK